MPSTGGPPRGSARFDGRVVVITDAYGVTRAVWPHLRDRGNGRIAPEPWKDGVGCCRDLGTH